MNSNSEEQSKGCSKHGGSRCGVLRCILAPFFIAGFILLKSYAVYGLWNFLIPDLFNGPVVTFVQALGLFILAKLLFGSFHRHGGRCGHRGPPWLRHFKNLSDEDRAKLREKYRERCASKDDDGN